MSKTKDKAIEQDNRMKIWNQVSKTDPDHTKQVSFGRKFTAIDAHSQVMEATRTFGPVGEGWGYDTVYSECHTTDGEIIIFCDLTFWWSELGQWEGMPAREHRRDYGPVRGCVMLKKKDKAPDTDAPKKAMTDALTKALSHLGFNADVFLGLFDDNKYVETLKKEKVAEQTAEQRAYQEDRAEFIKKIKACTQPEQIDNVLKNHTTWMAGLPAGTAVEIRSWAMKQKQEMEDGSE